MKRRVLETTGSASLADDFLRNACLTYGGDWQPSLVTRARQLLEEHPGLVRVDLHLLDAGADPNDGQTLYNRHFRSGDEHLRLLLSYGLGSDRGGPWYARFGDRLIRPAQLLVDELWAAARKDPASASSSWSRTEPT